MAFLPQSQQELDAQKEKDKQAGGSQTQEQVLSGGSGYAAGTGASGQATGGGSGSRSGFVNLQDYLKANEGDNATDMAGAVSKNIDNSVGDYRAASDNAVKSIGETAAANTVIKDTGLGERFKGGVSNTLHSEKAGVDAGRKAYGGPSKEDAAADYSAATTPHLSKFKEKLNLAGSHEGIGTLLEDTYKDPNREYSKGEKRLDNFIVSGSEAGKSAIQNTKNQYSGIDAEDASKSALAAGAAESAATTSKDTNDYWASILGGLQTADKQMLAGATRRATDHNRGLDDRKTANDLAMGTEGGRRQLLYKLFDNGDSMNAMEVESRVNSAMEDPTFDFEQLRYNRPDDVGAAQFLNPYQTNEYRALREYMGDDGFDTTIGSNQNAPRAAETGSAEEARKAAIAQSDKLWSDGAAERKGNTQKSLDALNAGFQSDRESRVRTARAADIARLPVQPGAASNPLLETMSEEDFQRMWNTSMGNQARTLVPQYGSGASSLKENK